MPGVGPSPSKAAFPDQGDTDEDVKQGNGWKPPTPSADAAPKRFEVPADPKRQNPDTSTPANVSSGSESQGAKVDGQQGGSQVTDNAMLFGEKAKRLHAAIDDMIQAIESDSAAVGVGDNEGPSKMVAMLRSWKQQVDMMGKGRAKL